MKTLCLLVHEPFRVLFEVWNMDDPYSITECAVKALDLATDLGRLGFVISLAAIDDDEGVEICDHQGCVIRRAYIQEVLNDLRDIPERPLSDILSRN